MDVGKRLREAREERGLSLIEVEQATRIRRVFLEALEAEQFDLLPEVYVKGFLRNYAQFLGLDPQPMLTGFSGQVAEQRLMSLPDVLDEPLGRPAMNVGPKLFLGLMLLLMLGLGGWYSYTRFYLGEDPAALVGQFLGREGVPIQTPSPTSPPEADTPVAPAADSTPEAEPTTASTEAEPTPTVSPTPRPTEEPTPRPTIISGVLVEARVIENTYIEVTLDDVTDFVGILEPGEDRVWTAERLVELRLGNAGGLILTVNGEELPPLGESGEVLNVEYTADGATED